MPRDDYQDFRDLEALCGAIGGRVAPLIAGDFADIRLTEIAHDFPQGVRGVRFEFVMSNHSLEKVINSQDLADSLDRLVVPYRQDPW